jgi:hypothetical protein
MGVIPRGGRNVVTNTVLPRFFAQKVVTKGRNIFGRGRNSRGIGNWWFVISNQPERMFLKKFKAETRRGKDAEESRIDTDEH